MKKQSFESAPLLENGSYYLRTTPGMYRSAFRTSIATKVELTDDYVRVVTEPKNFGYNGNIPYTDIKKVVYGVRPSLQYICGGIITMVLGRIMEGETFELLSWTIDHRLLYILAVIMAFRGINFGLTIGANNVSAPACCLHHRPTILKSLHRTITARANIQEALEQ